MKNKITAVLVALLLFVGIYPTTAIAADSEDIVILYENDVHCVIEGYSKLAAMKNELRKTTSMSAWFPAVTIFRVRVWVLFQRDNTLLN